MPRIVRQPFQPSAVAVTRAAIGLYRKSRLRGALGMRSEGVGWDRPPGGLSSLRGPLCVWR